LAVILSLLAVSQVMSPESLILDFATTQQNKTTIAAVTTAPPLFQLTDKHLANVKPLKQKLPAKCFSLIFM